MILYEAHNMELDDPYTMYGVTNLNWELHFHRAYEFIFVTEGEIQCKIDNNVYNLDAGKMLFVMPNQLHSIITPEYSQIYILRFAPDLIGGFHNAYLDLIPKTPFVALDFPFYKKSKPRNLYALKGVLYQICGEVIEQTDFVPVKNSSGNLLIYSLLEFVDKHFTEECSLTAAAEACCCDYFHASRTFMKYTGLSFVDYVNNMRIHRACYLIKNTNDSFINISFNCGFSSLRSFNRNFLKYCNCTPSEYRENILSTGSPGGK